MEEVLQFMARSHAKNHRAAVIHRPTAAFYPEGDGVYSFVNQDWSRLAGVAQADALGDGWLQSVHPYDRAEVALHWRETVEREGFHNLEYRLSMPSQRLVWVLCQAMPQYDREGKFIGYSGMLFNVTAYRNGLEPLAALPAFAAMSAGGGKSACARSSTSPGLPISSVTSRPTGKPFRPLSATSMAASARLRNSATRCTPATNPVSLPPSTAASSKAVPLTPSFRLGMPGGGWRKTGTQAKFVCGGHGTPSHLVGVCASAGMTLQSDGNMHLDLLRRVVI